MTPTNEETKHQKAAIADTVYFYRFTIGDGRKPTSVQAFAGALSRVLEGAGMNVSHQTICNWENGVNIPKREKLYRLAGTEGWIGDLGRELLEIIEGDAAQLAAEKNARLSAVLPKPEPGSRPSYTPTTEIKPGLTPKRQIVGRHYRNGQTIAQLHQPKRGKHTRHETGETIPILLAVRVSRDTGR